MAMPRRFWVLTGWVIALATLAAAFSVIERTYADLQDLGECNIPNLANEAACQQHRLIEGAASVAVVVARIPAIGLGLIATAIGIAAQRARRAAPAAEGTGAGHAARAPSRGSAPQLDPVAAAPSFQPAASNNGAGDVVASPGPGGSAVADAGTARARRRSKVPSTTLLPAGTGS